MKGFFVLSLLELNKINKGMSFPSDGRNHWDAVLSEKEMFQFKTELESYYDKPIQKIIHIGGTKSKIDFRILFTDGSVVNKSLKKKTNLGNGSFDYVNTSLFEESTILKSKTVYDNYKGKKDSDGKTLLINSISEDLQNMSSPWLTNFVRNNVVDKYEKIGLDILETSTRKLFINVIPNFFTVLKNGGTLEIIKTEKKQMSYKLQLFDKNGCEIQDCGLRIRLHLNNGWTKWKNGQASQLVIKIQQDKVSKLLTK